MLKIVDGIKVCSLLLLLGALVFFPQTVPVSAQSFNTDPVPGGMCGCMSCNCYMVNEVITEIDKMSIVASESGTNSTLGVENRSLTASLEDIHDAREDAVVKASTSATKTTTTSSSATKTTTSAASAGASAASSAAKTTTSSSAVKTTTSAAPSNPNTSTTKNSSGSPDDRDSSSGSSGSSGSSKSTGTPVTKSTSVVSTGAAAATKNSSGSPDDRGTSGGKATLGVTVESATGKASGQYPYTSSAGKTVTGSTDVRDKFLDTSKADFTAPYVDSSSYDPRKTRATDNALILVPNTFTRDDITPSSPYWDAYVKSTYKQPQMNNYRQPQKLEVDKNGVVQTAETKVLKTNK